MDAPILERIVRQVGVPNLPDILTEQLTLSDLQSLLLAVYAVRAKTVTPAALLQQYKRNRFVQPATLDPRAYNVLERLAFELLPQDCEAIELAPVCPLGTNSVIATVDQNNAVTTIRNTEVVADSTNVLALECASRRKDLYQKRVTPLPDTKLFASHRLLRAQQFEGPLSFAHFRVVSRVTAGRDRGGLRFETDALREHIEFYLRLVRAAQGSRSNDVEFRVTLTAFDESYLETLQAQVLDPLAENYADVQFGLDQGRTRGRGYYVGAAFEMTAHVSSGHVYSLVDGGCTDWMQKLLSNQKERLVISGAGSERLILLTGLA